VARATAYAVAPRPTLKHDGQPYRFMFGLTSSGVYICPSCYQEGGGLLSHLSILTKLLKKFGGIISVALALESPPPDVIRHSALGSPDFPHLKKDATIRATHKTYSITRITKSK